MVHTIAGQVWPEGTSVGVYPANAWTDSSRAPAGSAIATDTVSAGSATWSGLAENIRYVAYGGGKGITFLLRPDRSPDLSGERAPVRKRLEEVEAAISVRAARPLNLRDEGGDYTGSEDSAELLTDLMSGVNHVVVPAGTYSADDVIEIGSHRTVELLPGATLQRRTGTGPVVRLNGANFSRLIGLGTVQALNASPDGIVHVGPTVQSVEANIQRWIVRDVTLIGASSTATNLGLNLTSSEATSGGAGAGSNYLGKAQDLDIQQVGVGVKVNALCNAHVFRDINFHLMGSASYLLAGGASESQAIGDNSFSGGFTHTKASGDITVIKATGYVIFNAFFDVHAEPEASGDPGSLYYDLGANTRQNRILGFGNFETDPQGTDAGTNNVILDENLLQLGGKLLMGEGRALGLGSAWAEIGRSDVSAVYYALAQNADGLTLVNAHDDLRLRVNGAEQIRLGAGTAGFFGATPAAKPTGVAVSAAGIHAALVTLGLIAGP